MNNEYEKFLFLMSHTIIDNGPDITLYYEKDYYFTNDNHHYNISKERGKNEWLWSISRNHDLLQYDRVCTEDEAIEACVKHWFEHRNL